MLVARNLRRVNSAREILNVDYFSLNQGETVALVGPNGAGKTTFLLTLALLQQPVSGTIELDGITAAPHNILQLRRRMAVVFQEPLLLDMSVLANLTTALRIRKVPATPGPCQGAKVARTLWCGAHFFTAGKIDLGG